MINVDKMINTAPPTGKDIKIHVTPEEWQIAEEIAAQKIVENADSEKTARLKTERRAISPFSPFKVHRKKDGEGALNHSFFCVPDRSGEPILFAKARVVKPGSKTDHSKCSTEDSDTGILGQSRIGSVLALQDKDGRLIADKSLNLRLLDRDTHIEVSESIFKAFEKQQTPPSDNSHYQLWRQVKIRTGNLCNEIAILAELGLLKGAVMTKTGKWHILQTLIPGKDMYDCLLDDQNGPKIPYTNLEILEILRLTALAIENLHKKGILHNDIKPQNIHIEGESGNPINVHVLDYGFGCKLPDGCTAVRLTVGDSTIPLIQGSPDYMAPEIMTFDKDEKGNVVLTKSNDDIEVGIYSPKSDAYSFGLILEDTWDKGLNRRELRANNHQYEKFQEKYQELCINLTEEDRHLRKDLTWACEQLKTLQDILQSKTLNQHGFQASQEESDEDELETFGSGSETEESDGDQETLVISSEPSRPRYRT